MSTPRIGAPATGDAQILGACRTAFVQAMSALAGGVTVVTAEGPNGRLVGMTATSAVSISADPPMVSLSMTSGGHTASAIMDAGKFAINLMCADGVAIAQRFATSNADAAAGLDISRNPAPWLPDVASHGLQCELADSLDVGDHVLVVGRVVKVLRGRAGDRRGLVYWDRQWFVPSPRGAA